MVEAKVAEIIKERENVDEDEGPENSLDFEALEAVNTVDDFKRIDFVECEQPDLQLQEMLGKLNNDQKRVFDMVTEKMENSCSKVLRCFISGTGGTGKSFLIKTLKVCVQTHLNKKVAITVPTA